MILKAGLIRWLPAAPDGCFYGFHPLWGCWVVRVPSAGYMSSLRGHVDHVLAARGRRMT